MKEETHETINIDDVAYDVLWALWHNGKWDNFDIRDFYDYDIADLSVYYVNHNILWITAQAMFLCHIYNWERAKEWLTRYYLTPLIEHIEHPDTHFEHLLLNSE